MSAHVVSSTNLKPIFSHVHAMMQFVRNLIFDFTFATIKHSTDNSEILRDTLIRVSSTFSRKKRRTVQDSPKKVGIK